MNSLTPGRIKALVVVGVLGVLAVLMVTGTISVF